MRLFREYAEGMGKEIFGMTLGQLKFNFNMNAPLLLMQMKDSAFAAACHRIMEFDANLVNEALKKSIALHGDDKPRYYHIKCLPEILHELQKREHSRPPTPTAKTALKSWARALLDG
jgi:hypothetical protein